MFLVGVHIYSSLELLGQVFKGISQQLLSPNAAIHAFAVAGNVGDISSVLQGMKYNILIELKVYSRKPLCLLLWRWCCHVTFPGSPAKLRGKHSRNQPA